MVSSFSNTLLRVTDQIQTGFLMLALTSFELFGQLLQEDLHFECNNKALLNWN
jgi:hypothetical protein